MSNWEEGAPFWAPTRGEVHTWDTRPQGVSRGRGFEPAGRGRGIAKWTSQGWYCNCDFDIIYSEYLIHILDVYTYVYNILLL